MSEFFFGITNIFSKKSGTYFGEERKSKKYPVYVASPLFPNPETRDAIMDEINGTFDSNDIHAIIDFQSRQIPKPEEVIIFEKDPLVKK